MSDTTPPPPPPPYGQPVPGAPGTAPLPLAHWGKRAGGYLIDMAILLPLYIVAAIGQAIGDAAGALIMLVAYAGAIAVWVWNLSLRQGRTGQSIGKGVMNIRLLDEATGQPVGPGMAFVRYLVHIVDSLACYVGWLWPLWDDKRQTFTDKILKTVVVEG